MARQLFSSQAPVLLLLSALLLLPSTLALADTQVTTYVIKTQDEREKTRWSLTEWLRIKERMKLMDLWLAIFSDPKKDHFQPELMLSAFALHSQYKLQAQKAVDSPEESTSAVSGGALKAQLWLTNLISSGIGLRLLNIDLGAEAAHRQSASFTLANTATPAATNATGAKGHYDLEVYSGALRIFGRNIQDSSLVLKYGRYSLRNPVLETAPGQAASTITGPAAGAELQLYILRALGAEGNVVQYAKATDAGGFAGASGLYYDYLGFIEISLLRLVAGPYVETWSFTSTSGEHLQSQEKGLLAGLKLQF